MTHTLIFGDCLDEMKKMADKSIDFIITDPPYGIAFADLEWDKKLPDIEIWKEALRICKPGSYMAVFGGTKTHHRLMCAIEDSGWQIRDVIMWLYGEGFPKATGDVGIVGYKASLKPAWEPIILAMKPCIGSYKNNFKLFNLSGMNIEACKIPRLSNESNRINRSSIQRKSPTFIFKHTTKRDYKLYESRWPANLIIDDLSKQILDQQVPKNQVSRFFYCAKSKQVARKYIHPTQKPLDLMTYIIKLLAPPEDPVCLDPFCGSGTTLVAARELGIRSIGIEKNLEYFELAQARLNSTQSTET